MCADQTLRHVEEELQARFGQEASQGGTLQDLLSQLMQEGLPAQVQHVYILSYAFDIQPVSCAVNMVC